MKLKESTYQDREKLGLYFRSILKEYLNYEEKLEDQKKEWIRSTEYVPSSEEVMKSESKYMRYKEKALTEINNLKLIIKSSISIKVKVSETEEIELKDFLKSRNILFENFNDPNIQKEELERLENAHKIGEEIE